MTIEADTFPMGYFYIISKMNGLALDIDFSEGPAKVSISSHIKSKNTLSAFC